MEPPARPKIPPPSRPPAPSGTKILPTPPHTSPPTIPRNTINNEEKIKPDEEKQQDDEEDPWARFNRMSEQVLQYMFKINYF